VGSANLEELDMAAVLFKSELVGDDVGNGTALSAATETTVGLGLEEPPAGVGVAMTGRPGAGSCPSGGEFGGIASAEG
jgi:hypothetical protein